MQHCSIQLEEWGGGRVKEMYEKLKVCRSDLRKYRSRRDAYGINKYNDVRQEYLKLLERQEIYWQQRAKQMWLKEGDQNSQFFHRVATGRKKNNSIKGLMNKHDEWKENREDIQQIIVDYFTELFSKSREAGGLTEREAENLQGWTD
ncbi:hypothetical protein POM88_047269 [Heracleum sosnowskyi]|uniref:Uncharacterized protein n=1 Tax=Heracleum sosnowskyi TaxID=360622 RepID=A0AAD8GU06_9APIA|nr:hypothetical protein POM88_047269 [Heracleum sosnowskyi]